MKHQLISHEEAVPAKRQHKKPCSDCPWARVALPGWLGAMSPEEWLQHAHGESMVDCHAHNGAQCAGMAIFRSNIMKRCRSPHILLLPKDRVKVFASDSEFLLHHRRKP